MEKVLITGGRGLVGKHLIPLLIENGFEVVVLSRSKTDNTDYRVYQWNIEKQEIEKGAFDNVSHIIHLAGANIGEKRWSMERKKVLLESRVNSAQLICNSIKRLNVKLKSFVSASATGIYGTLTSERIFTESDPSADDYLGQLCSLWEKSADDFIETGARVVKLRTGIVLTSKGGALERIIKPIKMGIGSPLGSGKQFLPWIHINDLCKIYLKALTDEMMSGAINAVAPNYITNKELTVSLARVLQKPLWLPRVPSMLIKAIFGEMSDIILKGSRVSAEKMINTGVSFKYKEIKVALDSLI